MTLPDHPSSTLKPTMTTHTASSSSTTDANGIPAAIGQPLRQAAIRRNVRTAAVLVVAVSGALVSSTWLAATAGSTFAALTVWRYLQLRQEGHTDAGRG